MTMTEKPKLKTAEMVKTSYQSTKAEKEEEFQINFSEESQ